MRTGPQTRDRRWPVSVCRVPGPQLPIAVPAPAVDTTAGHENTRVVASRNQRDGS